MEKTEVQRHLITAALPYANGPIHIGHLAGAYLPADIYARFLRMKGDDVAFICGSDEHGAAITLRAKKEGTTAQTIVDRYHALNAKAFEDFGINFDIFHRTSSIIHNETAQEFFLELEKKGAFTKETREQFYDADYNQFLADRYVTGTCPKCSNERAYGDQCENCGTSLNPTDLINPISTLSGKTPVLRETSHWYLPMDRHETWLKEWIENGTLDGKKHHDPKEWRNQVIGQCKSWIDGGLHSRAMTRDLDWGVKVPTKDGEGKVLYVWLDAPIGYISATKEWAANNDKNWKAYWQNEKTELVHFIGKDNIVFHCIIFPILLKTHEGFNLPNNVPANEFLNLEGDKISTSRDWAVWLHEFNEDFPGKQDALRYVLCSIAPESKDSEFTWDAFQARNNSELVAIYGNFVNRATVLVNKYYDGTVPVLSKNQYPEIEEQLKKSTKLINEKLSKKQFRDAQNEAINIARLGNKFLAETEPWKLIKTDPDEVQNILHLSLQIAANCAIALAPFLPNSSAKLASILGIEKLHWNQLGSLKIVYANSKLNQLEHLFQKIENNIIAKQKEKLENKSKQSSSESTIEPFKDDIIFDDLLKLDLRVGTILRAKPVPKSNKLLKFTVDLGSEQRTILSGIAKHYSPEEMLGKQVQVIANLPPRKMMGIESQGMILMAENSEGELSLLQPDKDMANGSTVN